LSAKIWENGMLETWEDQGRTRYVPSTFFVHPAW
jgi:hypothetical protein